MSDQQKTTKEEFRKCFEGMPFAEMMQKMMAQKGEGFGFDCAEMMAQMMKMCCRPAQENEETPEEAKETQTANQ